MKSKVFLLCFLTVSAAHAADDTGWFPTAHDVFKPLLADPRELQYSLQLVARGSHKPVGEAAMGDYLGMYRWSLGGEKRAQVSIGGGAFGRFKLATAANEMQVVDFYGNAPFDYRVGPWSGRFMMYHTSSHLGDDYLAQTGQTTTKHSWDNLTWLTSYNPNKHLRMYGGYTYSFRQLPSHLGRNAFQAGFETYSSYWGGGHARAYWANDFQSWERSDWNPTINSQVGLRVAKNPEAPRAISFYIGFMAGRQPQGQFFLNEETRWNFGIKFDLT